MSSRSTDLVGRGHARASTLGSAAFTIGLLDQIRLKVDVPALARKAKSRAKMIANSAEPLLAFPEVATPIVEPTRPPVIRPMIAAIRVIQMPTLPVWAKEMQRIGAAINIRQPNEFERDLFKVGSYRLMAVISQG